MRDFFRDNFATFTYRILDFKGRSARGEYFHFILLFNALFVAMVWWFFFFQSYFESYFDVKGVLGYCAVAFSIYLILAYFSITIRRCHDFGKSTLFAVIVVLLIIPSYFILGLVITCLCVFKESQGVNQWGEIPKNSKNLVKIGNEGSNKEYFLGMFFAVSLLFFCAINWDFYGGYKEGEIVITFYVMASLGIVLFMPMLFVVIKRLRYFGFSLSASFLFVFLINFLLYFIFLIAVVSCFIFVFRENPYAFSFIVCFVPIFVLSSFREKNAYKKGSHRGFVFYALWAFLLIFFVLVGAKLISYWIFVPMPLHWNIFLVIFGVCAVFILAFRILVDVSMEKVEELALSAFVKWVVMGFVTFAFWLTFIVFILLLSIGFFEYFSFLDFLSFKGDLRIYWGYLAVFIPFVFAFIPLLIMGEMKSWALKSIK